MKMLLCFWRAGLLNSWYLWHPKFFNLIFSIQKALYGILKSALLLCKKVRHDLEHMGFTINQYDLCVTSNLSMDIKWCLHGILMIIKSLMPTLMKSQHLQPPMMPFKEMLKLNVTNILNTWAWTWITQYQGWYSSLW